MFEGKTLHRQFADARAQTRAETGDGLQLRELVWSELVARLAASSEGRAELERVAGVAGGSFGHFPKVTAQALCEGKYPVNRNALEHGKISEAHGGEAVIEAVTGDRENS